MNTYAVQPGDSFYAIADQLGVSRDAFAAANPQVTDINQLSVGQVLNIPGATDPGGSGFSLWSINPWVAGGVVVFGTLLLKIFWKKGRRNPGAPRRRRLGARKARKSKRTAWRINPSHVLTAYQVGNALIRRGGL